MSKKYMSWTRFTHIRDRRIVRTSNDMWFQYKAPYKKSLGVHRVRRRKNRRVG